MSPRPLLAAALLAVLLAGCAEHHRVETTLLPDGRVERAVYHPVNAVPEPARQPNLWTQVTYVASPPDMEKAGWSGAIRDLPVNPPANNGGNFAAWGTFPSPDRIPDHLLIRPGDDAVLPPGRLARAGRRLDYGLVIDHRWDETLTDIVTLPDLRAAREELVTLLADLVRDIFDEALGRDYDAAPLVRWLRTEGRAWAEEATEQAFVLRLASKGPDTDKALADRLLDQAAKRGLVLRKNGRLLDGDDLGAVLFDWAADHLAAKVLSKKDGQPAGPRAAADWIRDLRADTDAGPLPPPFFRPAFDKVIARKYGGQEALDNRLRHLMYRIVGLYFNFPLGATRHFRCTLTVPGAVVQANGQLIGGSKVRWDFEAGEAWPAGYRMTCRALDPQRDVQRALLGRTPLVEPEPMLAFCDLVAATAGLDAVLRDCRDRKSLDPLYAFRPKNETAVQALFKLLGMPLP